MSIRFVSWQKQVSFDKNKNYFFLIRCNLQNCLMAKILTSQSDRPFKWKDVSGLIDNFEMIYFRRTRKSLSLISLNYPYSHVNFLLGFVPIVFCSKPFYGSFSKLDQKGLFNSCSFFVQSGRKEEVAWNELIKVWLP